jgi:starch synthase
LIDYDAADVDSFNSALSARVGELLSNPTLAAEMGKAGRRRVLRSFGWPAIAAQTVELYDSIL